MRTLFTCSLNWEQRRRQGPYGTPRYAYTNSVPDQQSLYPDGLSSSLLLLCVFEHSHSPLIKISTQNDTMDDVHRHAIMRT